MDSWISGIIGGDKRTITGLSHLNGKDCQVTVDGALHDNKTVSGGTITLDFDAFSQVIVGLQYTPQLKTLPIDTGVATGTSKPHFKQFNKFIVMVINSESASNPLINGVRTPTASQGVASVKYYGVTILGWDREAQVTISQDLPRRLNIAAIYGELSQENF